MAGRDPLRQAVPFGGLTVDADGLADLARALGHDFANPGLLHEALVHRSGARADTPFGYERLEFLGDRVLGLVVAEMLMSAHPDDAEGVLARRLNGLVRREVLAKVAAALDLGRFLVLGEAEDRAGSRSNAGIQSDACEALIGALYLDGGLEAARRFIHAFWQPLMADHGLAGRDAKTALQEWAQARSLGLPLYEEKRREGPAHEPAFTVAVSVAGFPPAEGRGPSKRAAEQEAAGALLARLKEMM